MKTGSHAKIVCDPDNRTTADKFICVGWVNGFVQGSALTVSYAVEYPDFCLPSEGGSVGQYIAVFNRYLEEHPERLHLAAAQLFREALAEAFPCST